MECGHTLIWRLHSILSCFNFFSSSFRCCLACSLFLPASCDIIIRSCDWSCDPSSYIVYTHTTWLSYQQLWCHVTVMWSQTKCVMSCDLLYCHVTVMWSHLHYHVIVLQSLVLVVLFHVFLVSFVLSLFLVLLIPLAYDNHYHTCIYTLHSVGPHLQLLVSSTTLAVTEVQ